MSFLLQRASGVDPRAEAASRRVELGRWSLAISHGAAVTEQHLPEGRAVIIGRPWARDADAAPRWERVEAHQGRVPLDRLDGSFLVIFHHAATGRVWLATDRHGSQLAYVASRDDGAVAAGSSAREVARACAGRPLPDPVGMLQWLHCGYIPTTRTVFEGVRRVPYGTWMCLDTGERSRYWRFDATPLRAGETESEMLDGVTARQDRAVARALTVAPAATTLMLSGGWDSRAILSRLAAGAARGPTSAATFGVDAGGDVRIARELAARVGLAHVVRADSFERVDEGIRAWARGLGDLTDNVFATLPGGPRQVAGLPGAALWVGTDSFSTVLPPERPSRESLTGEFGDLTPEALDALSWLTGAVSSRSLLPPELDEVGLLRPSAQGRCDEAFDEIDALLIPHAGEAWDATFDRLSHETRFRVWNVNRRLFEQAKPLLTPWHDVDLVEYYAGLPQGLRGRRRAHQRANERASALFRDTPVHSEGIGRDALDALRGDPDLRDVIRERAASVPWTRGAVDGARLRSILDGSGEAPAPALWVTLRLYLACTTFLAAWE